jgi:hypothetical protein
MMGGCALSINGCRFFTGFPCSGLYKFNILQRLREVCRLLFQTNEDSLLFPRGFCFQNERSANGMCQLAVFHETPLPRFPSGFGVEGVD